MPHVLNLRCRGAAVFRPSLDSTRRWRPIWSRFPCERCHVFEAIRALTEDQRTPRRGPRKSAIVEAVAHLSIELLERYALKEVSEAEKQKVEKHVASCRKCEFFLEEQLGWMAAMRSPFRRYVEKLIEAEGKKAAKR